MREIGRRVIAGAVGLDVVAQAVDLLHPVGTLGSAAVLVAAIVRRSLRPKAPRLPKTIAALDEEIAALVHMAGAATRRHLGGKPRPVANDLAARGVRPPEATATTSGRAKPA